MALQIDPSITEDNIDTGVRRHVWTRTEALRAAEIGLFSPTIQRELIAGELIEKMTQNRPHGISLSKAQRELAAAFGDGYYVSVQTPLAIDEENEPEPDLMVVAGAPDDYADHPTVAAVPLVMEVSDTTVHYDQNTKANLYARAGVREYWILLLKTRTLEVRRDPMMLAETPARSVYRSITLCRETDVVTPMTAGATAIQVSTLLPIGRQTDIS